MSMTPEQQIEVIRAKAEGRTLEVTDKDRTKWVARCNTGEFDFTNYDYRIAPPAKVRKWQWVCQRANGVQFVHDVLCLDGVRPSFGELGTYAVNRIEPGIEVAAEVRS